MEYDMERPPRRGHDEIHAERYGRKATVDADDPTMPLLYALRDDAGLHGPRLSLRSRPVRHLHRACGRARDALVRRSDFVCRNKKVVTLEGLSKGGKLHPVQQAFIDEQAAQVRRHRFLDWSSVGFLSTRDSAAACITIPLDAIAHWTACSSNERLLHRMQLAAFREALERDDLLVPDKRNRNDARAHRAPVHMHGAGAALAETAAEARPVQAGVVAQCIEQRIVGSSASTVAFLPLTFSVYFIVSFVVVDVPCRTPLLCPRKIRARFTSSHSLPSTPATLLDASGLRRCDPAATGRFVTSFA